VKDGPPGGNGSKLWWKARRNAGGGFSRPLIRRIRARSDRAARRVMLSPRPTCGKLRWYSTGCMQTSLHGSAGEEHGDKLVKRKVERDGQGDSGAAWRDRTLPPLEMQTTLTTLRNARGGFNDKGVVGMYDMGPASEAGQPADSPQARAFIVV